jgi:aspartate aminotransferase
MQLTAERLSRVKASASEAASRKARELLSAGVDLISLATGEPDFDTPEHVIEAALVAMRAGQTKYTSSDGTPQLK